MTNNVHFGIGDRSKALPRTYHGVDLKDLTTPKEGYVCMLDRFWLVSDGKAMFYGNSPQCNSDVRVIQHALTRNAASNNLPNLSVVFVAVAFVRPSNN